MGKKSRTTTAATNADGIGPRQPCPCGSGKRYKACHGSAGGESPYVVRTFEGLRGECDWVALREFVPAGTAPLTLADDAFDGAAEGRTVMASACCPASPPHWCATTATSGSRPRWPTSRPIPSRDFAEALRLGSGG